VWGQFLDRTTRTVPAVPARCPSRRSEHASSANIPPTDCPLQASAGAENATATRRKPCSALWSGDRATLSRWRHGFESRWGCYKSPVQIALLAGRQFRVSILCPSILDTVLSPTLEARSHEPVPLARGDPAMCLALFGLPVRRLAWRVYGCVTYATTSRPACLAPAST